MKSKRNRQLDSLRCALPYMPGSRQRGEVRKVVVVRISLVKGFLHRLVVSVHNAHILNGPCPSSRIRPLLARIMNLPVKASLVVLHRLRQPPPAGRVLALPHVVRRPSVRAGAPLARAPKRVPLREGRSGETTLLLSSDLGMYARGYCCILPRAATPHVCMY